TRYTFLNQGKGTEHVEEIISGVGIGEIVESKHSSFPVKSVVLGFGVGWGNYVRLSNPRALWVIPDPRNPKIALTEYANALGVNGLTAHCAVESLVKFKKDQVVYVSSAAGPVGSFFGILAKRQGAFVIGSAGSDEKVDYIVKELGFDVGINYKTKDLNSELSAAAPNGIDIYFDLVGGETLDIAFNKLKQSGQAVIVGNTSEFGADGPYTFKNFREITVKGLSVNGFTAFHHLHKFTQFWDEFKPLVADGTIKTQKQTVVKGLENAPQAFVDYLAGKYHGKVVIQVGDL
ncbi:hypothetical protein BGZ49_005301, partial [Haplosporangium sp. Z 27]